MSIPSSLLRRLVLALSVTLGLSLRAVGIGADSLDQITVQAQRDREKLKHDVDRFVSSAIVQSRYDGSLERWTYADVCPQVAGLNEAQGQFLLARLSQIARAAGVPLGGQLVTTPRPIRVWRNIGLTSIDGLNHFKTHGEKYYKDEAPSNTMPSQYGSRLNASTVTRDIVSAVIVVDAGKIRALNFGQLADYIGMAGFSQADLDKDLTDAPTILNLFRASAATRPQEMTAWDRALLHALYTTPQRNKMQLSEMQMAAFTEIAANHQN